MNSIKSSLCCEHEEKLKKLGFELPEYSPLILRLDQYERAVYKLLCAVSRIKDQEYILNKAPEIIVNSQKDISYWKNYIKGKS
jgi:hypothetical protein